VSEQQKWAIDGQSQIRQQYENKCRETSQHVDKEKTPTQSGWLTISK